MVHLAFICPCSSAYQLIVVVIVISAMIFTCLSLLVRFWGTTYQVHGEVRVLSYYSPAFLFSYRRLLSGFQDVGKVFFVVGIMVFSFDIHLPFCSLIVGSCLDFRMSGKEKQYACQTYCFLCRWFVTVQPHAAICGTSLHIWFSAGILLPPTHSDRSYRQSPPAEA